MSVVVSRIISRRIATTTTTTSTTTLLFSSSSSSSSCRSCSCCRSCRFCIHHQYHSDHHHHFTTKRDFSSSTTTTKKSTTSTTAATAIPGSSNNYHPRPPKYIKLVKLLSSNNQYVQLKHPLSRKKAERYIRNGSIKLAGKPITEPNTFLSKYDYANHALTFNNKAVPIIINNTTATTTTTTNNNNSGSSSSSIQQQQQQQPPRVWLVHKLIGEIITESSSSSLNDIDDFEYENFTSNLDDNNKKKREYPSLMERLKRSGLGSSTNNNKRKGRSNVVVHLNPIGRLDMNTEGLLIVTDNGLYKRQLELPTNEIHRTYRVRVHGSLTQSKINAIQTGRVHVIDKTKNIRMKYKPMKITIDNNNNNNNKNHHPNNNQMKKVRRQRRSNSNSTASSSSSSTNHWIQVTCTEGKNRQIRKIFQQLNLNVTRLIRISYGDYHLQTIPPGMAIEVPYKPMEQQKRKGPLFSRINNSDNGSNDNGIPNNYSKRKNLRTSTNNNNNNNNKEEPQIMASPIQWIRHA